MKFTVGGYHRGWTDGKVYLRRLGKKKADTVLGIYFAPFFASGILRVGLQLDVQKA